MVAKSLEINTHDLPPFEDGTRQLIMEWSPAHFHVLLKNTQTQQVEALESFQGEIEQEEDWQMLLGQSRLLHLQQLPAWLVSASPRAMPIPAALYHATLSHQELDLLMGQQASQAMAADMVAQHELMLAWQMPMHLLQWLQQHFQILSHRHLLGQLLLQQPAAGLSGRLVVADAHVFFVLQHNEALLFAGAIPLLTPDDLMYRILNICRIHAVETSAVKWVLSGTIAADSLLFAGIDRFLNQLSWWPLAQPLPKEAPGHYFAHLLPVPL